MLILRLLALRKNTLYVLIFGEFSTFSWHEIHRSLSSKNKNPCENSVRNNLIQVKGEAMNRIFKVVFSAVRGNRTVVSEAASTVCSGKTLVVAAVALIGGASVALASEATLTYSDNEMLDAAQGNSIEASESITGNNAILKTNENSSITTGKFDWLGHSSDQSELKGAIKAAQEIIYRGIGGHLLGRGISAKLETPSLTIVGTAYQSGLKVQNNEVLAGVEAITIKSEKNVRTGILIAENLNVNFDKSISLVGDGDARIEIEKGAHLSIGEINSQAGRGKIQLDDNNARVTVKALNVQGGSLNFEVLANGHESNVEFNVGTVTVADNSRLNASVYSDSQPNLAIKGIDGSMTINLGANAIVDFGGVKNDDWRPDKISLDADTITVNVANLQEGGKVYLSKDGTKLSNTQVLVKADGSNNSGDVKADLEKLSKIVSLTDKPNQDQATKVQESVATGTQLSLDEGLSGGAAMATVGDNGTLTNVVTKTNSIMSNVLDIASVSSLSMNRILMNDVRKRLGDIRSASGTHGAWVRYDGGKLKGSNSLKNNFTTVQVGIDTMPSDNAPRFGLAFAYTKTDADMKRGDADMDSYSLALYGTKTFENGVFVDVIGRVARSDADYTVDGNLKGSADNTVLSLSGEIGWRYDVTPMFFVEPQAELTYTYTDADTLKLGGVASYSFDTVDSLLGRAGFAAGLNCPDGWGNVYVHASAVHEFLGDATIRSGVNSYKVNGEDTWVEYGLGANINIGKNAYVYGGVERTSGATLDEEWRAHVGFRYSF